MGDTGRFLETGVLGSAASKKSFAFGMVSLLYTYMYVTHKNECIHTICVSIIATQKGFRNPATASTEFPHSEIVHPVGKLDGDGGFMAGHKSTMLLISSFLRVVIRHEGRILQS